MPQRDGGLVAYLADAVGMVRPEADPPDEGVSAFKGKGCIPLPFGCGETSELHHLFIVLLCERGPAARGGGAGEAFKKGRLTLGGRQKADECEGAEPALAHGNLNLFLEHMREQGGGPCRMALTAGGLQPAAEQHVSPVGFLRPVDEGFGRQAGMRLPPRQRYAAPYLIEPPGARAEFLVLRLFFFQQVLFPLGIEGFRGLDGRERRGEG